MSGIKLPVLINCITLVILLVINEAGTSTPWLTWVQTSRRWTRLRAIMDPNTWIASAEKPYHLLLSSESAVDKAWFAIGYDKSDGYIYWSDSVERKIYRQKQNDSLIIRNEDSVELVYEFTSNKVTGMAVDWYSGGVYWADAGSKTISMTRANKGRQDLSKVLINFYQDEPSGIVVHPAKGLMFFAYKSFEEGWKIEEASLTGGNRRVLLSQQLDSSLGKPECISYDYESDTLYWVDTDYYQVKAHDLRNPGQIRTVINGLSPQISWPGITNYQDHIFLSAQADLQIHAYRKSDGQQVKTYTIDATPHHLVIAGEVSKPPSECDSLGCEHFCVSLGDGRGKCVCADGYYIELDQKSCLSVDPQYIYSRGRSIWHADVTIAQNAPRTINMMVTPFITDVAQVQALAFHYKKNYLYLNDIQTDVLYRNVPLESNKEEITVNTRQVEGMTVNWITDTLYWADNTLDHIMCSQLDGRYHTVLVPNAQGVRGIAVDAIHKMMFWITSGQSSRSIMKSNLDGSDARAVMTQGLNHPQGISVDPRTSKVFWTDAAENRIYSMDLQGANRRDVINGSPDPNQRFYGLTLFKDYATYTMGEQDLMFGMQNQQNQAYFAYDPVTDIRQTMRPNYGQPQLTGTYDVVTFDSYMQPSTDAVNVCDNSKCQQHCFPVSAAPKCECAIGFTLNEDEISCDSEVLMSEFLMFTDPYHKQIYQMGKFTDTPQGVYLPLMEFPISMDVDSTGTVYWIDRKAGVIQSSPILLKDQLRQSAKLLRQIPQGFLPEKLVVDEAGGHVYYTDSQVGSIYRMKLDGSNHEAIINGVGRCVGLVVDPPNDRLYWSELGARLMTARMDGSEAEVLSQDRGQVGDNPRALTYWPDESMLYFADELTGTIKCMNTTTRQMSFLFQNNRYRIIALTADSNFIYFTTFNEKGIYRIKREGGDTEPAVLGAEIFARVTDIKTFDGVLAIPVPVTATGGGFSWMYIAIAIAAGLLLLFMICMIGVCAARRKRQPPSSSPIIGSDTSATYENVDQEYINHTNGMANGLSNGVSNGAPNGVPNGTGNGIPPPPAIPPPEPPTDTHARVHYTNNGYTPDENGTGAPTNGPAVAVLPAIPVAAKLRKTRYKKKENKPKPDADPNEFQLGEDQKVATVIQRLAHRLRNRLSSVRYSGGPTRPAADQENFTPEYDPEAADGQPGAPESGRGPGPKRNITYQPQLHRPPRGFAPASHTVPTGAIKSTWGRGKHARVMGNKK